MPNAPDRVSEVNAAEQEFLSFGWDAASFPVPAEKPFTASGFRRGDFAAYAEDGAWIVLALPANLVLGRLPSASAVRRFAAKCVSFPAQPNGAIIGAARQAMLQAVEEELGLARQATELLERKIDDLMGSIDDIRAKAILFQRESDS